MTGSNPAKPELAYRISAVARVGCITPTSLSPSNYNL